MPTTCSRCRVALHTEPLVITVTLSGERAVDGIPDAAEELGEWVLHLPVCDACAAAPERWPWLLSAALEHLAQAWRCASCGLPWPEYCGAPTVDAPCPHCTEPFAPIVTEISVRN
jgi:hypothetical protein